MANLDLPNPETITILLVEDSSTDAALIQELLSESARANVQVVWRDRLDRAKEYLADHEVDGILLDLQLPDSTGLGGFEHLNALAPMAAVLVLTGLGDEETAIRAVQAGAQDYLVKGTVDSDSLLKAVFYGMGRKRAEAEVLRELRRSQRLANSASRILHSLEISQDQVNFAEAFGVVLETLESISGCIGIIEPDRDSIICHGVSSDVGAGARRREFIIGRDLWSQGAWAPVLIEKQSLQVNQRHHIPNSEIPVERSLAVPLLQRDELIGLIQVANKETDYSESDLQLLQQIASIIAPVLSARLQRDVEEVDRKIAEHALREVSEERKRMIRELEEKNAELDRFTYTVSHDLKSPLITIKGFLGLFEKNFQAGDKEKLQGFIERIKRAADQMKRLLDELLELSRIGRVEQVPQRMSLTELANNTIEMFSERIRENQVEVVVEQRMPEMFGDRTRLQEIVQNLIENALRFLSDQPNPKIEIGGRVETGETVYFVKDNGIGIQAEYQEKVFGLFEQLNPQAGGTGLGLAIVRRIVEIHQGRIWIESEGVGKGTTFCFTLNYSPEKMLTTIQGE